MGKHALLAVGGGGLSALASLAAVYGASGGLMLAYFAPLPLLLVGLGLGTNAAAIAASAGLILVALTSGAVGAGVYGGLHALPSWLVVYQALRRRAGPGAGGGDGDWYPIGAIAATLAAITGFAVACTAVVGGGGEGIEPAVRSLLDRAMTNAVPGLDAARRGALVEALAPLFVGLTGASWQLMIALNAVIAATMLASRGRALRPKPRWGSIAVPGWLAWPLAAAAAAGLVASGDAAYLARNLVIVLALPYLFVGLAIVHHLTRPLPGRALLLTAIYLGLVLLGAAVATILAGLGMVAQWSGRWPPPAGRDFRNRE